MGISDIPSLSMLRTRLDWLQARQRILADNVANADNATFSRPRSRAAGTSGRKCQKDPGDQGKMKQVRQIRMRRRMIAALPKATVVITNPTHYHRP